MAAVTLSAIICTHRRPDRVDWLLDSLTRQTWCGNDWEVLIVENDAQRSPELARVIGEYEGRLPLRWCLETTTGLSRARNRGAQEASGEYLVYLDDDEEVDPGWLEATMIGCREFRPHFFGGPIYALYRVPKPYWYMDEWEIRCYHGDSPRVMDEVHFHGGNFGVRRELVLELGGFREDLGMSGNKVAYGEETDLMLRGRHTHPDLLMAYLPNAVVRHEVRANKMSIRWLVRSTWASARDGLVIESANDKLRSWPVILRVVVRALAHLASRTPGLVAVAVADLFRPGRSLWRRYVKERMLRDVRAFAVSIQTAEARLGFRSR